MNTSIPNMLRELDKLTSILPSSFPEVQDFENVKQRYFGSTLGLESLPKVLLELKRVSADIRHLVPMFEELRKPFVLLTPTLVGPVHREESVAHALALHAIHTERASDF